MPATNKQLATEKKNVQNMLKKAKADASSKKTNGAGKTVSASISSSSKQDQPRVPKKNVDEIRKKVEAELAAEQQVIPEPPFQYEIHVKRQILYVRVQLHKTPHQFLNLDETNDKKLVVDTTKYTRKNRLVFNFPDGLTVDSSKAEYEFESGVLRCSFPIKQLPSSEVTRVKGIIQQEKNSRKIRFEHQLDQNSGLETRTRTRTMDLNQAKNAKQLDKKKLKQRQMNQDAALESDDDDEQKPKLTARQEREMILKINTNNNSNNNNKKNDANNKKAAAAKATTTTSSSSGGKYVSDSEGAKIASQVSRAASQTIKENISKNNKIAAAQNQKKQKSLTSSQHKKDVLNRSFLDIVKQKQEAVRQQIANATPVEKKKNAANSKSVSFA